MMMPVPVIQVNDYDYDLPEERIAKFPLPERDQSKLLVWKENQLSETVFSESDQCLPENSLLISNNTRVIHARMLFENITGAKIEIFCLEPWNPADYQLSFQQTASVEWRCLVGNAKKWKVGKLEKWVDVSGGRVLLKAEKSLQDELGFLIRFTWDSNDTFATILESAGKIPIPPYLNRPAEESDDDRYQTIYARTDGSVAAPTAGLHFTEAVLNKLKKKNILFDELTLHVGAGTFQPVKSEEISGHAMHTETVIVSRALILRLLNHKGKIIAVGTTSVRSLESLYWLGIRIPELGNRDELHVSQWDPYQKGRGISAAESMLNLLQFMDQNHLDHLRFSTAIIIVPGYNFRIIDGMFTNFHQPRSTLLMLVAAFLGTDWKHTYSYALENGFRFLSYGDSNLYLKS